METIKKTCVLQKLKEFNSVVNTQEIPLGDAPTALRLLGLAPTLKQIQNFNEQHCDKQYCTLDDITNWAQQVKDHQIPTDMLRDTLLTLCKRFDTELNGTIPLRTLKSLLCNVGETFTEEEINSTFIKELLGLEENIYYPLLIEKLLTTC